MIAQQNNLQEMPRILSMKSWQTALASTHTMQMTVKGVVSHTLVNGKTTKGMAKEFFAIIARSGSIEASLLAIRSMDLDSTLGRVATNTWAGSIHRLTRRASERTPGQVLGASTKASGRVTRRRVWVGTCILTSQSTLDFTIKTSLMALGSIAGPTATSTKESGKMGSVMASVVLNSHSKTLSTLESSSKTSSKEKATSNTVMAQPIMVVSRRISAMALVKAFGLTAAFTSVFGKMARKMGLGACRLQKASSSTTAGARVSGLPKKAVQLIITLQLRNKKPSRWQSK